MKFPYERKILEGSEKHQTNGGCLKSRFDMACVDIHMVAVNKAHCVIVL